jgi:hypothetical protein
MPVYKFTSSRFEGKIFLEYENGQLTKFINYSQMDDLQLTWLSGNFPMFENMLPALQGKSGTVEMVQQHTDFECFNQYLKKS